MSAFKSAAITPSAARLTESLRDIGYDFPAAVADIVDNSIMAGASRVDIVIEFDGEDSSVVIADDGRGMTANGLIEALRYGSRRDYSPRDLGRYGLGLKTASLSQCRSVTVVTRRSRAAGRMAVRTLDLDLIAEWDEWLVVEPARDPAVTQARERLTDGSGTVVIWRKLDRVLPEKTPRRRLGASPSGGHGSQDRRASRDCFPPLPRRRGGPRSGDHGERGKSTAVESFRARRARPDGAGVAAFRGGRRRRGRDGHPSAVHIAGSRDQFSSAGQFEKLSGPLNWNRQQGLYIYRADRLVQWGGWNGIRGIDEHTKLARAALDFDTDLDSVFNINVAKMRVTIPPQIRQMLERPINELCAQADDAYRKTSRHAATDQSPNAPGRQDGQAGSRDHAHDHRR